MQTKAIKTALLLAGAALALPATTDDATSCTAESSRVKEWTVRDFDFHASYVFTTPAHQNSWGYANFTLENPVLDYKPICSAQSNWLNDFFYGSVVYDCKGGPEGNEATFTYSRPSGDLRINQTWHCPDENSRFEAEGGVKLDLDCEEEKWQNPDWDMGELYSSRTITCAHVTVAAPIDEIRGVA